MQTTFRLALAVLALSANSLSAQQTTPTRITSLSWLAGEWSGSRGAVTFEERWTPAAGGVMLGNGRTIKGEQMVEFEFLRIIERDGKLVYVAQPNGAPPTDFVMSATADKSITFENPTHDFPKQIRYTLRDDGKLEA